MRRQCIFGLAAIVSVAICESISAHSILLPGSPLPRSSEAETISKTSSPAIRLLASTERSTKDLANNAFGHHIHVMYVLPSDGMDQQLDTNGTIRMSVAAFRKWFAVQVQGKHSLRFDTRNGVLDVTFHRLAQTDAEIAASGAYVRDRVETGLKAAGFNNPKRIYAVYYGGSSTFACGGGAWPPKLVGTVAALYLNGTPPGAPPCAGNHFASSEDDPGYLELSMLHEIFHVLGAVATCAPHHTLEGHVSNSPNDLMYAGDQPWTPSVLDIGHDDYFGHHNPSCLDIAKSVFIDPVKPSSIPPPGWRMIGAKVH
jgi:hypothetical protein